MTVSSRVFAAMLKLDSPVTARRVDVRRDLAVRAPDGVTLLTDAYIARPGGPRPVILMRSPYGRRGFYGTMGRLFAERGYHAVVQSCRGTFGSGGGGIGFDSEAADGRAAADWIADQPWCDGTLGTFGGSYLGFTQLALASTRPPQLKAMALAIWGAARRAYVYPGGAFSLDRLNWAYTIENQERPFALARNALGMKKKLEPAYGHLPLLDADTVAVGHPVSFYRDWVTHDRPGDPFWTATDFRPLLKDLGVPVTMLAGWYDAFLPQMVADFAGLRAAGQEARLRVGAWHHTSQELFRYEFADALDWFGRHLLGREPDGPEPAVRAEVMGDGGWRGFGQWPPPGTAERRWHLRPGGGLAEDPPPESDPDRYTYDPADPTPAVGGTSTSPMFAGPRDNRALESRADVLTYTSAPLAEPLVIMGDVTAELFAGSSLPHADFFARLCDVDPSGASVNVCDGILRLDDAAPEPRLVRVRLWPTAHQFKAGHRIRLQVSSGAHPRYARNPGSGEPLATATTLTAARQSVAHDPARPSALLLPVAGLPERLAVDRELARGGQQRRQARFEGLDRGRVRDRVPQAQVPLVEELLRRVLPLPRDQQFELHLGAAQVPGPPFREPDQLPADPGALAVPGGGQQAELARAVAETLDPDAPGHRPVPRRDGDLPGPHQPRDVLGRGAGGTVLPQALLRRLVHVVDQARQRGHGRVIVGGGRRKHLDGEVSGHGTPSSSANPPPGHPGHGNGPDG